MKLSIATFVLLAGFSFSVMAEEQKNPHEQHHAAAEASDKKSENMNHEMHAMMGECMKMHKDGKMCEGQMMEQCQKNMAKGECSKMMKNTKMKTDK